MRPLIFFLFLLLTYSWAFSQTRTVTSATCGSCKKSVPASSKVGDRCPHCGVRWGYENKLQKTEYESPSHSNKDTFTNDYSNTGESMTIKIATLKSGPTNESTTIGQIPNNASIFIIKVVGNWVKITYWGQTVKQSEYIQFLNKMCDDALKSNNYGKGGTPNVCMDFNRMVNETKNWMGWVHKSNLVE